MKSPTLWVLEPNQYRFRIEFCFTDVEGKLLESKSWELVRQQDDPPKTYLLQASGFLVKRQPILKELGKNYYQFTLLVLHLDGPLKTSVFTGDQLKAVNRQIAAHPITFGLIMDAGGLHFSLYFTGE